MESPDLDIASPADGSLRAVGQAARRLAILDAAKLVFFEEGYQLASMDRIAERAETTKRTVYSYFPNKEALFAAVVEKGCNHVVSQLPSADDLPADPHEGLLLYARTSAALMGSPNCVRLERMILAEAERHPRFAATLTLALDAGEARLEAYIAARIVDGRLKPHDPALAARLLCNAIGQATSLRSLATPQASDAEPEKTDQALRAAIELYLTVYAAEPAA